MQVLVVVEALQQYSPVGQVPDALCIPSSVEHISPLQLLPAVLVHVFTRTQHSYPSVPQYSLTLLDLVSPADAQDVRHVPEQLFAKTPEVEAAVPPLVVAFVDAVKQL